MKLIISIFSILSFYSVFAQPDFEEAYQFIYSDKIASDVVEAHRLADSLLFASKNDLQRIKSHVLLATIEHSTGEVVSALEHAFKALKIAELCGFVEWEARVNGFIATTFRQVGLFSESIKALNKCDRLNESTPKREGYLLVKINILQERALYAMEQKHYHQAVGFVKGAEQLIAIDSTFNPRSVIIKATNDQLLGIASLHLGELSQADSLLRSSLNKLGDQESNLRPYIYRGLAEKFLKENDLIQTKKYLDKAEPYLLSSDRMELKLLLYQSFIGYYSQVNSDKAREYSELYNELLKNKLVVESAIADQLLSNNEEKMQDFERFFTLFKIVGIILMGLFLSLIMLLIFKGFFNKKVVQDEFVDGDGEVFIADETEKRLLQKLENLEQSRFFLDPEISLSKLAIEMDTNQKYASFIIKKHRGKDFNDCVQGRRIEYIVNRMYKEPDLLECKISYIASLSGFISHSKFSSAFKAEMGVLPSVFIQNLKSEYVRKN